VEQLQGEGGAGEALSARQHEQHAHRSIKETSIDGIYKKHGRGDQAAEARNRVDPGGVGPGRRRRTERR
jgi:hypothetical protein